MACLLYLPVGLLRRRPPGETAVGSMASGYVNAGNHPAQPDHPRQRAGLPVSATGLQVPGAVLAPVELIGNLAVTLGLLLGLSGHALLAVVVCAALPTAQNVFGYAVRFGQGVTLGRDAGWRPRSPACLCSSPW